MKTIHVNEIVTRVRAMCMETNVRMSPDLKAELMKCSNTEVSPIGAKILKDLLLNGEVAKAKNMPLCQDTGMVVVFVEIGQSVRIEGGLLTDAIHEGVRQGYEAGYLRKSVVADPLLRGNTKDNTPAIIHIDLVAGETLTIDLAAKGFGSENMSAIAMLKPSDGVQGVKSFVIETIKRAGSNPCPPIIVGVGLGGTMDKAAVLSKKALFRPLGLHHALPHIQALECELLSEINALGIGPGGLGGTTTALGVHIETYPTHIAGLPVAVNINCHASRHLSVVI